ncbi:MAG TPA: serine/threonine-protein kinase [Burkholderiaceae bacterium]|nr:serine/threonine-protein kinase [Burkholderiaceae bacterium]
MTLPTLITLPTEPSALIADMPRTVGRFTIRTEIGRGSNGVVYSAYDPVLSREVAIKAIPLTQNGVWEQRIEANFLNEAKAVAGLNHPHIVTVFDAGRTDSLAYIAMERLYGRDLHEVIANGHTLTFRQIASLLARVSDAVHFAHKRGMVHRDIKPSNIFLLKDGKPKVLDFGVALANRDESPGGERRQLIGTPNYMSPEQALGRKLDARSDVFSIGTILYELLAGQRAFEGKTIEETLELVIASAPTPVEQLRPDVPARLIEIAQRALEKDLTKRYQTAGELRNDLAAFSGQAPTAAANQARYGTTRVPRVLHGVLAGRNPPVALAAGAVLLVGVVALTAYLALRPAAPPPVATASTPAAPVAPPVQPITQPPPPPAPAAAEANVRPPAPPERPQVRRTARAETTPKAGPAADGYVALAVTPWGQVLVDGASRGVSPPLTRLTLPPGVHEIEIRNTAAPPFTTRIEVKSGQTVTLQHRF